MTAVAILTGGSRGIGRAAALKLGAAGYTVVVNYASNEAAANDVVKAITAAGGKAVAVQGDVAKEADILALFAAADKLGPLKVLVNNAGIMDRQNRLDEMSAERLKRLFDINILGSFLCAREAVKRMSARHGGSGGSIVNLGSAASVLGAPGLGVEYAASKGAIDVLTIGLGREVAAEGVRVNAVRPGIIDTEIHDSSGIPGRVKMMREHIPMKREGTADEVADAILWLCSDQSSYVTGSIIPVAGGRC
ncbi:MAG: SDR family oxidoreductase [Aestuariivirga sp.]|uniref:SDR family oxidoreductase n=1 Tax=Aestuariivirga sp. TaxID=2650926 RepID=UPI0025C71ED3|nr:SDR family oxidoreductase [Aestuariivirga sp.]MCA3560039.1 SDR family oxidoreductase [Aestuariivirga sp.]